ncbi:hypothetical protein D9M72_378210 [compost metagenome]
MRLEVSREHAARHRARRLRAAVADGRQRVAHADAIHIGLRARKSRVELSGEHARAHHHRREARALLVGPERNLQRRARDDAQVVERAHDLQAGQHAEVAVELAARGLGVDMAAGGHGARVGVAAGAACEDVADLVDAHVEPGLAAPLHHQVAPFAVGFGQRDAAHAAPGRGADRGEVHQRLPQAGAIDAGKV